MLVEKVIGNINDERFKNKNVDYVDIEWHEAFKKLHKKTSQGGIEVGIKLDNDILTRGLRQGDILAMNEDNIIAVNIPKDKALVVKVDDTHLVPKVCYEIGNRHATLFEGSNHNEFITTQSKNKLDAGFAAAFGGAPDRYFSAPGRTEIGGNHTDHQRGRVLAAAVNLDTVAALPVRFRLLYPTNCSIPSAPGWTVCWGKAPAMCCAFVRRAV